MEKYGKFGLTIVKINLLINTINVGKNDAW